MKKVHEDDDFNIDRFDHLLATPSTPLEVASTPSFTPRPPSVIRNPRPFVPMPPATLPKPKQKVSDNKPHYHHCIKVQVHAIYCCKAKYPLVIEFTMFGHTYTIHQKQSFRLQQSNGVPLNSTTTSNGVGGGGGGGVPTNSKVIIFDSDEIVPIPIDQDLPTFIVLNVYERVTTSTTSSTLDPNGSASVDNNKRRRRVKESNNTNNAATTRQNAINQISRGSWSAAVNISEIHQQQHGSVDLPPTASGPVSASAVSQVGAGGGSVEGTFDLIPTLSVADDRFAASSSDAPYMSLAIRYE